MFQQIDSNHNGQINQQELEAAGRWIARAYDLDIPQTAVQWLEQQAVHYAGQGGPASSLNEQEFAGFANAVASHFHLCGVLCVSLDDARQAFEAIDTNHNGSISRSEGEAALREFERSHHVTPTPEQLQWVQSTAQRDAALNGSPDSMGPVEFFVFANQFARHFN
jgi:hypothetical protein